MNPTSPIATACAASSRYAAPSLRYGPSGDATQPAATGFGMAGSALPATNDRRLTGSARPFTPRLNRHKGNRRSSAGCGYPNSRVSSAALIYNNPTTPYSCCQVVQRMGSTSTVPSRAAAPAVFILASPHPNAPQLSICQKPSLRTPILKTPPPTLQLFGPISVSSTHSSHPLEQMPDLCGITRY